MKSIHVKLAHKRRYICVFEILSDNKFSSWTRPEIRKKPYDNTFEKSAVGDMTKLSAVADQEIKCWILVSSSILDHS